MTSVFKKAICSTVTILSCATQTAIATPEIAWSQSGFDQPESVLAHPGEPLLYVSNINGSPTELNSKGYISLLSDDGSIIQHVWVNGMDAPKGMAMDADYLYVADMQRLHIIDYKQGKLIRSITAETSTMLNDITIDDAGIVYISDLTGGGIYRYRNNTLTQWISSDQLPHPNGLTVKDGALIVATWGEGMKEDFSTATLGGLVSINLETGTLSPYKSAQQFGNLDGIASVGDSLLISDWLNGKIFEFKNNTVQLLMETGKHAADISTKGEYLYIPMMFSQRIEAYKIQP
ncbi:hypothetical protein [Amphritea pacifica]|uniref:hypothetical protein n=1 Tax=Amphritea pacifica TaxID=2811233 RepID=UPI0019638B5D|nr:hypothetical protein [Amphritea pacifica]MBN1008855.1 hypothetical protein [Amphritea pacifica]